jgi:hypothetical protein
MDFLGPGSGILVAEGAQPALLSARSLHSPTNGPRADRTPPLMRLCAGEGCLDAGCLLEFAPRQPFSIAAGRGDDGEHRSGMDGKSQLALEPRP